MGCYSHLSDDEREQIGLAEALGHSIGAIAQDRPPKSTVWRELCRNRLPSGRYSPLHAAGAYQLRRRREARIERDRALRTFVVDRLAEGWTPEQISGWLKGGNEPRLRAVGCETIYAFIYRAAQQAEQLWRYLTRHHKRRRRELIAPSGQEQDMHRTPQPPCESTGELHPAEVGHRALSTDGGQAALVAIAERLRWFAAAQLCPQHRGDLRRRASLRRALPRTGQSIHVSTLAAVQARNQLRKPVSVTYRTGLGHAETEIGKWRAETGSTKSPVLT